MKALAIIALAVLAAASGISPAYAAEHPDVEISIRAAGTNDQQCGANSCHTPARAMVDVGGKVTWTNTDSSVHAVSSGNIKSGSGVGTEFSSETLAPGQQFTWSPTKVGTYEYFCYIHPWATGTITVEKAAAGQQQESQDRENPDIVMRAANEKMMEAEERMKEADEMMKEADERIKGADEMMKGEEGKEKDSEDKPDEGGGCLIATAAFGTETAAEVQRLREIRADMVQTGAGAAFMDTFNSAYYSFSPAIADLQRQSPVLKEGVRLMISPMLASLTLMDGADTEAEVVSYGIGAIMLNIGMYVGIPLAGVFGLRSIRRGRTLSSL